MTHFGGLHTRIALLLMLGVFFATPSIAADTDARVAELERIIKAQQAQLAAQAKVLEQLQKEVGSLAKSDGAKGFVTTGLAKSGNDKVGLKIYGQVNRGVLLVDDGHNAKAFSVDNDSSSTRIGLVGNVEATDNLTIGTKIEVQFESNSTGDVNQANNSSTIASNSFTERHLDLFFAHKRMGTVWLGQGSTASDAMASTDLSRTTLVGYSSVSDIAGGISFATSGTGAITGNPAVGDVFSDMTGLGRDDRVRYDTPDMSGFQLGTSLVDGGEWDLAGSYNRDFESLQMSVGGGYSNPSGTSTTTSSITHGSLSVMMKNGINATVAAGKSKMKSAARSDPGFQYLKLGYLASWTKLGNTAFAVDYGQYDDVAQNNDEASSYALMFVQNLDNWGTELYGVYRNHELKRTGSSLDDIDAVLMGARVKF
ncbi:MAG: porin [Alphaproteobacteria bacterium]|jgi:hypothetical protein|nr:porin [Alphaproteobacteria bacterium]MBT4085806.1 porin [Alphaproteobacteria bacterium]MBT4544074.1 porin [Alphaproteobacteria bacterium]MBT7747013.1 porin [Alphaproteobacteria bacterium]